MYLTTKKKTVYHRLTIFFATADIDRHFSPFYFIGWFYQPDAGLRDKENPHSPASHRSDALQSKKPFLAKGRKPRKIVAKKGGVTGKPTNSRLSFRNEPPAIHHDPDGDRSKPAIGKQTTAPHQTIWASGLKQR
ncbi:MAG: hypothetical protein ACOH2O_00930 [Pseudomonas sp.]